jgi:release factor glutamine methyltransferase
MTTYSDLWLNARRALQGLPGAAAEAQAIVCSATGKTRSELVRDGQLYASDDTARRTEDLLRRRRQGEPAAYLLGEWEFYGLELDVDAGVLIPRADTELLAQTAIRHLNGRDGAARLLDLCCGSGCVGLAVARHTPGLHVTLADISEGALRVARRNVRRVGLGGNCTVAAADARNAEGFGQFDMIVCNPPYIPTGDLAGLDPSVRDYEPVLALDGGADGLELIRVIIGRWRAALTPGGRLLLEVGAGQAETVRGLLREQGYEDLEVHTDTGGIDRVVGGRVHGENE